MLFRSPPRWCRPGSGSQAALPARGPGPVSYTHLDLFYDRYGEQYARHPDAAGRHDPSAAHDAERSIRRQGRRSDEYKFKRNKFEEVIRVVRTIEAVSYTHLDVYKRQI